MITPKKISRIHFFFISCPILVGFSLLYLKLAFLTFLAPKKRFFAKMRKIFEISANFFRLKNSGPKCFRRSASRPNGRWTVRPNGLTVERPLCWIPLKRLFRDAVRI